MDLCNPVKEKKIHIFVIVLIFTLLIVWSLVIWLSSEIPEMVNIEATQSDEALNFQNQNNLKKLILHISNLVTSALCYLSPHRGEH